MKHEEARTENERQRDDKSHFNSVSKSHNTGKITEKERERDKAIKDNI